MVPDPPSGFARTLTKTALALPGFLLLGFVAASVFAYGAHEETPGAYSSGVTWVGIVTAGGSETCRALPEAELAPHRDTLQVRFSLSDQDVARCRSAFRAYDGREGWPVRLRENERTYPGYGLEVEDDGADRVVTVRRFHGDAVSSTTIYRVDAAGAPREVRTSSTSSGAGAFAIVVGGGGGFLLWMLWAGFVLLRALLGRARGG